MANSQDVMSSGEWWFPVQGGTVDYISKQCPRKLLSTCLSVYLVVARLEKAVKGGQWVPLPSMAWREKLAVGFEKWDEAIGWLLQHGLLTYRWGEQHEYNRVKEFQTSLFSADEQPAEFTEYTCAMCGQPIAKDAMSPTSYEWVERGHKLVPEATKPATHAGCAIAEAMARNRHNIRDKLKLNEAAQEKYGSSNVFTVKALLEFGNWYHEQPTSPLPYVKREWFADEALIPAFQRVAKRMGIDGKEWPIK